jgi:hypothetical protein
VSPRYLSAESKSKDGGVESWRADGHTTVEVSPHHGTVADRSIMDVWPSVRRRMRTVT